MNKAIAGAIRYSGAREKTAAAGAIKALKALQSVTTIGVTYREYGSRVADAQIAVDEALPDIFDSRLKDEIKSAMKQYGEALTFWSESLKFDIRYSSDTTDTAGGDVIRSCWKLASSYIKSAELYLNCRRGRC